MTATEPTPTDDARPTHAVLIAGFWLGAWAWDDVAPRLRQAGIVTHALTLPGLESHRSDNTHEADIGGGVVLSDQVDAVIALVDALAGDIVLVGHSGGGAVVQGVIDRRPSLVRRVVYVDSGPLIDGVSLMPDADADVVLPTWDELAEQNSSIEGMDDEALMRFRTWAVPEPAGVARSKVRLVDDRRLDVPASVICTSFDAATLRQLIASGQIPSELESVRDVTYVDLPTGHWPMFSRPSDLAAVLRDEISR